MPALDVAAAIDEGRFGGYQKLLIAGTALAIVLDGADNQLLSHAIPSLMREWGVPRAALASASAAGPFGMMIGGVLGGLAGDRLGRRTALLASVTAFAVVTLAIAAVPSVAMLTALRFLAGIGLGGAMPSAAAMASEYAPRRHRPFAVTLTIVSIPVGGVLAGLLAGQVLPAAGWRALFVVGGLVTLVLALVLLRVLPESPRYLAARRERWPELRLVLRRLGHDVPSDSAFVETAAHTGTTGGSVGQIFSRERRRDSLALMSAFTCCLLAIYVGFLWIPAMLTDPTAGFSQSSASYALGVFNLGGVAGALVGALAIQRVGSRVALLGMSGLAVMAALGMAGMTLNPRAPLATLLMFAITGGLLNAVQTTMYALAAHVYPTAIRGTGIGATVAVGRVGNVLASYVGSWALTAGGPPLYFSSWAAAMTVVGVSLVLVRRHIPPTARAAGRTGASTSHGV